MSTEILCEYSWSGEQRDLYLGGKIMAAIGGGSRIDETNKKMGLPDKFDVVQDKDIDQMITWAKKEANPLYPVPVIWARKDFRRLIESIRK